MVSSPKLSAPLPLPISDNRGVVEGLEAPFLITPWELTKELRYGFRGDNLFKPEL